MVSSFGPTPPSQRAVSPPHTLGLVSLSAAPDANALDDKRLVLHDVRSSPAGLSLPLPDIPPGFSAPTYPQMDGWDFQDKMIKVWDIGARATVSTIQDTGEVWYVSWRPKLAGPGSVGAFVSAGEDKTVARCGGRCCLECVIVVWIWTFVCTYIGAVNFKLKM
ncbi:hypothetical protein C0995_008335 [Termitomyces sp. Mi166|nr:hypothetical protein C0995_008335 [Termitomyces sp. Mi166\